MGPYIHAGVYVANSVTASNQSDHSKTESACYVTSETCYVTSETDIDIVQKHYL